MHIDWNLSYLRHLSPMRKGGIATWPGYPSRGVNTYISNMFKKSQSLLVTRLLPMCSQLPQILQKDLC